MGGLDEALRDATVAAVREAIAPLLEAYEAAVTAPAPATYNVTDAATVLGVSADTIRRWVKDGTLPALPNIDKTIIPRRAVDALLDRPAVAN